MNPVDKFLSDPSRNYDEGVALLKARFLNKNIIRVLEEKRRPESHLWMVLEYNLSKFAANKNAAVPRQLITPEMKPFTAQKKKDLQKQEDAKPAAPQAKEAQPLRPKYVYNQFVDVSTLPEKYQKKYQRITDIYQESETVHEAMKKAKTDEDRQPLAAKLVELEDEQLSLWEELDKYSATIGNEKANAAPSQTQKFDMVKSVQRLKVIKDNIGRAKKALKDLEKGTAAYTRKEKAIQKFTEELADLNAAIEAHK